MKKPSKTAMEYLLSQKQKNDDNKIGGINSLIPEFKDSKINLTDIENVVINILTENKMLKLKIEELENNLKRLQ